VTSKNEFEGMFHDLVVLLKEHVPLSTSSIVASNVSFILMPFLVIWIQFNCDGFLLVCDS
jgi:hypothetical protein